MLALVLGWWLMAVVVGRAYPVYDDDGPPACPLGYTGCARADPGTCARSATDCPSCGSTSGDCCGSASTWTKYVSECALVTIYECDWAWVKGPRICSTADKCIAGETGLRAGKCDCSYSSVQYKTCCNGASTNSCQAFSPSDDGKYPDEGVCPGGQWVFCGQAGQPACGATACTGGPTNTPVAGATATPTKAPACVPEAGKTCADASGAAQCYSWAGSGCNWCSSSNSCVCGNYPTESCPAGAVCALPGAGTCNKPVNTPAGACPQGLVCCENAVAAACPAPANCQNLYWTGGDENATSRACGSLNPPQQSCGLAGVCQNQVMSGNADA